VRAYRLPAAVAAVAGLVVLTAWIMAWPVEKAAVLAPVLVVGAAAVVGLFLLWGKIAVQALRESRHPKRVLALWIGGLALLVLLTFLGVKLPKGE
jgi:hypothetical protein